MTDFEIRKFFSAELFFSYDLFLYILLKLILKIDAGQFVFFVKEVF